MKVLVISDSHGNSAPIRMLLDRYKDEVQTVVHLGNYDFELIKFQPEYPSLNFVVVAGNGDYGLNSPKEQILTIGDFVTRRVLLLHGHNHNVNNNINRLMYYALEKEVDACLFGHTHIPYLCVHEPVFFGGETERLVESGATQKPRSCLIMNPGSVSQPRGGSNAGYGILTIDNEGNISGELLEL